MAFDYDAAIGGARNSTVPTADRDPTPQPLDARSRAEIETTVNAATRDPEQRELLTQAYERAAITGDAGLKQQADDLAQMLRDREVLQLSRSLSPGSTVPEGWHKANEQELASYGVSADELHPQGSGFNADVFVPDDGDARPVMVFEGTDFGDPQDVNADVAQALGNPEEYYNRAMSLATQISQRTGGEVEFSGHSLGGGLATAAAEVTGNTAIVSNPAGVHVQTTQRFLAERGLSAPAADDIRTYVVDGDLLTGLQHATQNLSPDNADVIAGTVDGIAGIYNRISGNALPTDATGDDLRALPDAAGRVTVLDARNADGSARPAILSMDQIIDRSSQIMNRDATIGTVAGGGGGAVAGGIIGSALGPLGTIGGSLIGGWLGSKAGEAGGRQIGAVEAGIELAADGAVRDSVGEMVQRHMADTFYGAFDYRLAQMSDSLRAQLR